MSLELSLIAIAYLAAFVDYKIEKLKSDSRVDRVELFSF